MRNCENCRFYFEHSPKHACGECRRAPPVHMSEMDECRWPAVSRKEGDWCGKWKDVDGVEQERPRDLNQAVPEAVEQRVTGLKLFTLDEPAPATKDVVLFEMPGWFIKEHDVLGPYLELRTSVDDRYRTDRFAIKLSRLPRKG